MSTYTIFEINGDSIGECDPTELGVRIQELARNVNNERYLGRGELPGRAIRVICVLGNQLHTNNFAGDMYFLQRGVSEEN